MPLENAFRIPLFFDDLWQNLETILITNLSLQIYLLLSRASSEISSKLNLSDSPQKLINLSILMKTRQPQPQSQSQISQFYPRIIVVDGSIQSVSTIDPSHLFGNRLWLPSPIKFISSESISENESIQSVVIENMSELECIETKAFEKTNLQLIILPASVEVLDAECFSSCSSLSFVLFETGSKIIMN
jgi:hypothetical protein